LPDNHRDSTVNAQLELPAAYLAVWVDQAADVVPHALQLAAAGAEEGTLAWHAEHARPELQLALVLRPLGAPGEAGELRLVAAVAAAIALAEALPPMVTLGLGWPAAVLLGGYPVAWTRSHAGPVDAGRLTWLVLELTVSPDAFAATADQSEPLTGSGMATRYARQMVLWLDRWVESGTAPAARVFEQRLANRGQAITYRSQGGSATGILTGVDSAGRACLQLDGRTVAIAVDECLEDGAPGQAS